MNIAKERRAIEAALDSYRQQLDFFTDELLSLRPIHRRLELCRGVRSYPEGQPGFLHRFGALHA
jgi:hypothetical protein